jgi:hypothetical protein
MLYLNRISIAINIIDYILEEKKPRDIITFGYEWSFTPGKPNAYVWYVYVNNIFRGEIE